MCRPMLSKICAGRGALLVWGLSHDRVVRPSCPRESVLAQEAHLEDGCVGAGLHRVADGQAEGSREGKGSLGLWSHPEKGIVVSRGCAKAGHIAGGMLCGAGAA